MEEHLEAEVWFVDPELLDGNTIADTTAADPVANEWPGDSSLEAAAEQEAKLNYHAKQIENSISGLTRCSFPYSYIDNLIDEGVPEDVARRRHNRVFQLQGEYHGYFVAIEFRDMATRLVIQFPSDAVAMTVDGLRPILLELAKPIVQSTGQNMVSLGNFSTPVVEDGVNGYLKTWKRGLAQARRQVGRYNWYRRAGLALGVAISALSFFVVYFVSMYAIESANIVAATNMDRPLTFETIYRPEPHRLLGPLFPDFELAGRIIETGENVHVEVFRDEYLSAGPGSQFTAFATNLTEQPYVLRNYYESKMPIIKFGFFQVSWHAIFAPFVVVLWFAIIVWPILRTPKKSRASVKIAYTKIFLLILTLSIFSVTMIFIRGG